MKDTTDKDPLVSVAVFSYNSAKYIKDTLESVYNQTYQKIELIISDDGSSDETVKFCQKWIDENKQRFIRAELITSPYNTGIPANCNRGLYAAKGEWIKLIAGDDILIKDCIENNLKFLEAKKEPVSFLFSRFKVLKGNTIVDDHPRIAFYKKFECNFHKTTQKQFLALTNVLFVPAPTGFFNRNSLMRLNGFDESFLLAEDFPMWLKATSYGFKLHFNPSYTVIWRISNTSLSEIYNKNYVYLNIKAINKYFSIKKRILHPFHYLDFVVTYNNRKRYVENKKSFAYLTLLINPLALMRAIKRKYLSNLNKSV
jgi:alpha-1,3-rhamnosyltransferase